MPIPVRVINDFVVATGGTVSGDGQPTIIAHANGGFAIAYILGSNVFAGPAISEFSTSGVGNASSSGGSTSQRIGGTSIGAGQSVRVFQAPADGGGGDLGDIFLEVMEYSGSYTSVRVPIVTSAGFQTLPEIITLRNGNFLVAWYDVSAGNLLAAAFRPNGLSAASASLVSVSYSVNSNIASGHSLTLLNNGNVVIAWTDNAGFLRFRILTDSGAPVTAVALTSLAGFGDVSVLNDGSFVLVGSFGFQVFNDVGFAVTGFINFTAAIYESSVTPLLDGRFMVAGTNAVGNIAGEIFRPDGTSDGGQFTIAFEAQFLQNTSITTLADGRVVVSWQTQDGSVKASGWDPRETGVTVNGTTANDSYIGSAHADTFVLGEGNDRVDSGNGNDTLFGNAGTDTLNGEGGDDLLNGGGGADTMNGGSGTDTVSYANAGSGVYFLAGDTANATGEARGDVLTSIENIIGSNFADAIGLGSGDNRVDGGGGNDQLFGQDGNDVLIGGAGADILNGGNGIDIASYENATAGVYVLFNDLGGSSGEAAGDTFIGIEGLRGGIYNDFLGMDAGNNLIFGGGGDDQMFGQGGDDVLDGGIGADLFNGGTGTDTATYQSAYTGDIYLLAGDFGNAYGDGRGDSYVSIENIIGSNFRDIIGIGEGDNRVEGRGGNDWLWGQGGNDVLLGGVGGDLLDGGTGTDTASYEGAAGGVYVFFGDLGSATGEAAGDSFLSIENITGSAFDDIIGWDSGNNIINGGAGNDRLFGMGGNDTLIGGAGNDRYAYTGAGFGNDAITLFEDGADKIDFTSYAGGLSFANVLVTGVFGGVTITLNTSSDTIFLGGVTAGQITAADFLF